MVNMNDKMRNIISDYNIQEYDEKMHRFLKEIVSNTKIIKECVIYDVDGINESDVDFDSILRMFGDLTGYEVSCNEFRYERRKGSACSYLNVADDLKNMLESKYLGREFVIYVCVDSEYIEIRFHTYREAEDSWLDEDLNKYSKPILCVI